MQTVLGVLLLIMSIFLIAAVLMQNGKSKRLSGSIAGGAETFFGKAKSRTIDAVLSKVTTVVAILFVIIVIVVYVAFGSDYLTQNEIEDLIQQQINQQVTTENELDADVVIEGNEAADDAVVEDNTTADDAVVEDNTAADDTVVEDNTATEDTTADAE